ncbi:hypothetical protein GJ496_011684, partial [Pomphorhynchus laevis]
DHMLSILQNKLNFLKRISMSHSGHERMRKATSFLLTHRLIYILTEITSPVITPLILLFYVQPKAAQIIDFFRSYTLATSHYGDICTFSVSYEPKEINHCIQSVTEDSLYKMQESFQFLGSIHGDEIQTLHDANLLTLGL